MLPTLARLTALAFVGLALLPTRSAAQSLAQVTTWLRAGYYFNMDNNGDHRPEAVLAITGVTPAGSTAATFTGRLEPTGSTTRTPVTGRIEAVTGPGGLTTSFRIEFGYTTGGAIGTIRNTVSFSGAAVFRSDGVGFLAGTSSMTGAGIQSFRPFCAYGQMAPG